jgi:cobalamin biosynthesis Co2+ chelatase CbiK
MSNKFLDWLVTVGTSYYETQCECIAALISKLMYKHGISDRARKNAWASLHEIHDWDDNDWKTIRNNVMEKQKAAKKYIQAVSDMIKEMGFDDDQTSTLIQILCTDKVTEETRNELVKTWTDYTILTPFTSYRGKNTLPIQDNITIETSRKALYVRF